MCQSVTRIHCMDSHKSDRHHGVIYIPPLEFSVYDEDCPFIGYWNLCTGHLPDNTDNVLTKHQNINKRRSTNKTPNAHGRELIQFRRNNKMLILNRMNFECGNFSDGFTCFKYNGLSIVDYTTAVCSVLLYMKYFSGLEKQGPDSIWRCHHHYRKPHCGDKAVVRSSYLHNGISYTDKMTSLYQTNPLVDSCQSPLLFTLEIKTNINYPWKTTQYNALKYYKSYINKKPQLHQQHRIRTITGIFRWFSKWYSRKSSHISCWYYRIFLIQMACNNVILSISRFLPRRVDFTRTCFT